MFVCKSVLLLGILAAAIALPLDRSNWQLVPNSDGHLHLVNVNPFNLPAILNDDPESSFDPENDIVFSLFTRSNTLQQDVLQINDPASILNSHFNPAHPTRITIHGWNTHTGNFLHTNLRHRLHAMGEFNVITVDWTAASTTPDYISARNAVGPAGFGVGRLIDQLIALRGADVNDFYVIGSRLGAHVAGNAGKHHGGRINTIVGLDPAGPLFSVGQNDVLSPQDGQYVETIMTNAGLMGIDVPLGQANFYPNGGRSQPGCGIDIRGNCARTLAEAYYVESTHSPVPFRSTRCANYEEILVGKCTPTGPDANMGGEPSNYGRGVAGIYFLTTNDMMPFAQG